MKKVYLITFACLLINRAVWAQEQLITYHGQFRTLLSDNRLEGNLLRGDSTSAKRGALGTMYLDLGITVKPSEDFKLLAEFRMRNVIGENGQQVGGVTLITRNSLIDTRMIFRQIRAEGSIKKIVHYQIGDIDLGLSKYTLYNNNDSYNDFESDIYKERRVIPHYENFQNGNNWRLQGAVAKTQINFKRPIRRIDASLFGTRTRQNSSVVGQSVIPDRFLLGGKLDVLQSKYLSLGANWIHMMDLPGSVYDSLNIAYNYNNQVLSGTYKITPYNKGKFEFNIQGEHGISKNSYYIASTDSTAVKSDYFVDAGIKAEYKPKKITLTASYINVGHNFISPGAQTLRLHPFGSPFFVSKTNNNQSTRDLTVFDRYSDDMVYNQRIQTGLMRFNPIFGNVLPYGNATPNRKGLIFNIGRTIDTTNILSYNLGGALLSEIVSEGDSIGQKLRQFTQIQGGVLLNIAKLINSKRAIKVSASTRYEQTTRTGFAFVNLKTLNSDLGASVELMKGLHVLGGLKYIQYSGTEVLTNRDVFGTINGYEIIIPNGNQTVLSGALRLDLFKNSFASVEYNKVSVVNADAEQNNYRLSNLFINITIKF